MARIMEVLRTQMDSIRLEKQQLEVENARLREEHLREAAWVDAAAECDRLREKTQRVMAEARQLKTEYDQLSAAASPSQV
jgi:ABC-type phosphate transport system auxiliary subunit